MSELDKRIEAVLHTPIATTFESDLIFLVQELQAQLKEAEDEIKRLNEFMARSPSSHPEGCECYYCRILV